MFSKFYVLKESYDLTSQYKIKHIAPTLHNNWHLRANHLIRVIIEKQINYFKNSSLYMLESINMLFYLFSYRAIEFRY